VLQIWGIDIASLAVLISALSVGIGFGLQNIANNFISGIIISFDRSMKVGDFIQLNDLMGTVERIGTRSTELRTLDHVSIVVPNSRFLEEALVNWNHGNPVSRIGIPVDVAYGSDSDRVRTALLEVARNYEPLLPAPEPQVWFRGFGDSALKFELLVWIRDPQNQFKYMSELNYRIYDVLARYNIEIPFPQRDLHLKSLHFDPAIKSLELNDPNESR
jgi:small-conductance mechanosensitive channel